VATSLSAEPGALTRSRLAPAIPDALVLRLLPMSAPLSPVANASAIPMPLTAKGLPLSLTCTAAAKLEAAGIVDGGSVLKVRE